MSSDSHKGYSTDINITKTFTERPTLTMESSVIDTVLLNDDEKAEDDKM